MMLCQLSVILGFQGCGTSVVLRWLYAQMQLSKRLKLQEKLRESFAAQQRADLTEAEGEPTGKPKEDEKSKDDLVRKLKQAEQERQAEQESAGARARGAAPTAFHQAVRQARISLRRRARQRRAHRAMAQRLEISSMNLVWFIDETNLKTSGKQYFHSRLFEEKVFRLSALPAFPASVATLKRWVCRSAYPSRFLGRSWIPELSGRSGLI